MCVCLNGHAMILHLDVLVTQKNPGRVVMLVQPNPSLEVDDGPQMVSTQAVEVPCTDSV